MDITMSHNENNKRRTLKQLLMCFIGALLTLLLLGSFFLNISITREYLQKQLQSHAQDAATSLGLSLSTVIDARDQVVAARMIDVIFDSGDYRQVVFNDVNGEALITRQQTLKIDQVPDWFVQMIDLETPAQTSQVMSGWNQLGSLKIASHPGYAYVELWRIMQTQVLWFAVITIIGLILAQLFISSILKPLMQVEKQAHDMSLNKFGYKAPMPKTRELARVASAMNNMGDKLGRVFKQQLDLIETLRAKSFIDTLTGLSNREGFDSRLKAELESQQRTGQGCLLLIQLSDFSKINQAHGRALGDELLTTVASVLAAIIKQHSGSFAARRSGVDFSVFLPGLMSDAVDDFAVKLLPGLNGLPILKQLLRDDVIHLGLACVESDDNAQQLLSKADMALRQAQTHSVSAWQRYANIESADLSSEVHQANEWHTILKQVLADRSVSLHTQPVVDFQNKSLLYYQVLARIDVDDKLVVAGLFLPMAERFQLMIPFDRMVIEKVLQSLKLRQDGIAYCVTLSESSMADEQFLAWLNETLLSFKALAGRLIFEVSEHTIHHNEDALKYLCDLSTKYDFKLSVDRFGSSSVPFSYLQRIGLDIIKLDHGFIRDIQNHQSDQFFLHSAVQIAHSQEIQVMAVGVESEQEWNILKDLGLDGAMGYYLGRPTANDIF
ncbi:MAG: diguanylate cyclase (GGDEF)-like protein [Oleiphilaceae bacterium]|jgi:diguanylate cyclase (GGDEF)-like protein